MFNRKKFGMLLLVPALIAAIAAGCKNPATGVTLPTATITRTPTTAVNTVTRTSTTQAVNTATVTETTLIIAATATVTMTATETAMDTATVTPTSTTGAVILVPIGSASTYGVFGGSAGMTNSGIYTRIVGGDIGTTGASTLVTGYDDSNLDIYTETPLNIGNVSGIVYCDAPAPGTIGKLALAQAAWGDISNSYTYLTALPAGNDPNGANPGELGGLTLTPGIYTSAASTGAFQITLNDLTLDGQGDPNAVFVFQMASTLTVGDTAPRSVNLIGQAQAKNVYWQVGSNAVINAAGGGKMVGTIICNAGAAFSTAGLTTLTALDGRVLSLVASVTLVNTVINVQ